MLAPLRQWICDHCGEIIPSPEAGMIEWLAGPDNKRSGFRIVHQSANSPQKADGPCGYAQTPGKADLSLAVLVGEVGMPLLLSFLDVGSSREGCSGPWVEDAREFVELTRRLTIPHYEQARTLWRLAKADGYFNDMSELEAYAPNTLEALVKKYEASDPPHPATGLCP
jgi:hypothetical protein